jgi:hypothetical protein
MLKKSTSWSENHISLCVETENTDIPPNKPRTEHLVTSFVTMFCPSEQAPNTPCPTLDSWERVVREGGGSVYTSAEVGV